MITLYENSYADHEDNSKYSQLHSLHESHHLFDEMLYIINNPSPVVLQDKFPSNQNELT